MLSYYPYFISSLPMLHFGNKPPFSFAKFLEMAKDLIPEKDLAKLADLPNKMLDFEICLRNELVKVRASRKHMEPEKYLRPDGYSGPSIAHLALSAHRNPSILEAERFLDQERWRQLEELQIGHFFDADFLKVYGYKLLILERWEKINA